MLSRNILVLNLFLMTTISEARNRDNLNSNQYDQNAISNYYGRYGSTCSAESLNNPYGVGSKFNNISPRNPYGGVLIMMDNTR